MTCFHRRKALLRGGQVKVFHQLPLKNGSPNLPTPMLDPMPLPRRPRDKRCKFGASPRTRGRSERVGESGPRHPGNKGKLGWTKKHHYAYIITIVMMTIVTLIHHLMIILYVYVYTYVFSLAEFKRSCWLDIANDTFKNLKAQHFEWMSHGNGKKHMLGALFCHVKYDIRSPHVLENKHSHDPKIVGWSIARELGVRVHSDNDNFPLSCGIQIHAGSEATVYI